MKKIIFTLILLITGVSAYAGNNLPYIKMGVKGGYTSRTYRLSDDINSFKDKLGKAIPAYHAGIMVRASMTRVPLYIQGEIIYEWLKADNGSGSILRAKNIDVPVLAGAEFDIAGLGFRLNTGPVFTILNSISMNGKDDPGWSDLLDKPISWSIGAGIDIWKLAIDVRYNLGFGKNKTEMNASGTSTKTVTASRMNSWTFSVGILF